MATRRYGTIVGHLTDDPETASELAARLPDDVLHHVAAALRDEATRRAVADGDHDAIVATAFDTGFGRDGLAVPPWVEGAVIVCPGGLVEKSRTNHRCRFVSVDDVWIWDSGDLIVEHKRAHPGALGGFRAVALLPLVEGLGLDVVTGRARAGRHGVEAVVSFAVRRGELVEVGRRAVSGRGMQ